MPTILKIIFYPIFGLFCLAFFTFLLFPFDSIKVRVSQELETFLGNRYSITIGKLSPSLLSGVVIKDIQIRQKGGGESTPISIKKTRISFDLLPLLTGTMVVDFNVVSGTGKANGFYSQRHNGMGLEIKADHLDLGIVGLYTQGYGFPLSGIADGTVKLDLSYQDPLKNSGVVSLQMSDLGLGATSFGGGALTLPALKLAQTSGAPSKIDVLIQNGNFEVKEITFNGGDLELQADGKVYAARQSENYRFNLKGNFKTAPDMSTKVPLLNLVEKQKSPDGTFPITLTGRISKPNIRIGEFKVPI